MGKYYFLILMCCFCSRIILGQNQETKKQVLNGHAFPNITQIGSSFTNTNLQADLGFGTTSLLQIPGIMVGEYEIFEFQGKIIFIETNVQYQQQFTPWLALFMSFSFTSRLGTNMSTIMVDGVNTISGGDIGWIIKLKKSDKLNLSGTIEINNLTGNFINVARYLEDVIDNNPNPDVINKTPAMNVDLGIRGAYAFNSTYGLQFQSDLAYGESFERTKSKVYASGGLFGDIDFLPKQKVPIGLALGFVLTSAPEVVMADGGLSSSIVGKIGYTGSSDFELGVQYSNTKTRLKSIGGSPSFNRILLSLRFFF